jgi:hypothetical protein
MIRFSYDNYGSGRYLNITGADFKTAPRPGRNQLELPCLERRYEGRMSRQNPQVSLGPGSHHGGRCPAKYDRGGRYDLEPEFSR